MRRHDLDLVSLVSGTVLLLVAVSFLVEAASGDALDLTWLLPGALVAVGVAGIAGALRRSPEARAGEGDTA